MYQTMVRGDGNKRNYFPFSYICNRASFLKPKKKKRKEFFVHKGFLVPIQKII